jgi:hypothetical protein
VLLLARSIRPGPDYLIDIDIRPALLQANTQTPSKPEHNLLIASMEIVSHRRCNTVLSSATASGQKTATARFRISQKFRIRYDVIGTQTKS